MQRDKCYGVRRCDGGALRGKILDSNSRSAQVADEWKDIRDEDGIKTQFDNDPHDYKIIYLWFLIMILKLDQRSGHHSILNPGIVEPEGGGYVEI